MLKFSQFESKKELITKHRPLPLSDFDTKNADFISQDFLNVSPEIKLINKQTFKAKSLEEGSEYYITLRKGNFNTEVDYAISKIYQMFLPNQPENHIVKDSEGNVYNASRAIKGLTLSIPSSKSKVIPGLATIFCLSYFFGDSDLSGNFGFQATSLNNNQYKITPFKYDNECFLDEELLSEEIPSSLSEIENKILSLCYIVSPSNFYILEIESTLLMLLEKKETIKKIIQESVRSTKIDEGVWLINKTIQATKQYPNDENIKAMKQSFEKMLSGIDSDSAANYSAREIIKLLDQRFNKLSQILNAKSKFITFFK